VAVVPVPAHPSLVARIAPPRYPAATDRYAAAIRVASSLGLKVWVEADLAQRWLDGPSSFAVGVSRLASLSLLPNVVGFKIADELGYHDGFDGNASKIAQFLADAGGALRASAPGKLILIDLLVPELGCTRGVPQADPCRHQTEDAYPDLRLNQVDAYLSSGALDVVDLSTGLLSDATYRSWGIDPAFAQRTAWSEAVRRGWASDVTLQGRKALAHAGRYPGTADSAETDARTYLDVSHASGAAAIDVWTWRQAYQGQIVRLMDPGLRPNVLWDALLTRHDQGMKLLTHFTPTSVELSVSQDLHLLATAFTGVFMAAGVG
jgi:hypothetical protein